MKKILKKLTTNVTPKWTADQLYFATACSTRPALISGFCSMKPLGVFLLPLNGMLVHRSVTLSFKFAGSHLYTWEERGTVSVLSKNTTQYPRLRLESRLVNPEASALTMPQRLHNEGFAQYFEWCRIEFIISNIDSVLSLFYQLIWFFFFEKRVNLLKLVRKLQSRIKANYI